MKWVHGHAFAEDGDYITYNQWTPEGFVEVSYWMIPGTWLED